MSRDYAKKSKSSKKTKKLNLVIWIILLLLFCMFVFALIYIKKESHIKKNKIKQTTLIKKMVTTPKFEFYNIAPKKEFNDQNEIYELEIAIANNFAAVDRLKTKLTLLGFTVKVTPFLKEGAQKYLISVGPYQTKEEALTKQRRLKRNNINSRLNSGE